MKNKKAINRMCLPLAYQLCLPYKVAVKRKQTQPRTCKSQLSPYYIHDCNA